jgi:cholesterol transport system auxiliary component
MNLRLPSPMLSAYRPLRGLLTALFALLLGACATAPGIPETTWHRLPKASPPAALAATSALPIVVQRLEADGLHADPALLYALDSSGQRLRTYHYHFWVDPPGALLQRRLVERLREAKAADRVTDQLPARQPALWVSGHIAHFERVPAAAGGFEAQVGLRLRVSRRGNELPLVDGEYRAGVRADDDTLAASVAALGVATDQALDAFLRDLERALQTSSP